METRIVVIASILCTLVAIQYVTAEPLEDQLPDTTGLFFGKRASHPNMNNLLFGRRSYADTVGRSSSRLEEARSVCRSVRAACAKWGIDDGDN